MSYIKTIQDSFIEQFNAAKPEGASKLAPRNGYFFISEIFYREVGLSGEVPFAKVNWSSSLETPFYEDVVFEIALQSLHNHSGERLASEHFELLNKVIFISDVTVRTATIDGKPKQCLFCTYTVTRIIPVFTSAQQDFLRVLSTKGNTLYEANKKMEQELGIDLTDTIYSEAGNGFDDFGTDDTDSEEDAK